ncbi:MAG: uroporphyrinogen decarboxylase family protein [Candidatus Sumerlaeota bacterium]|nr:uroporphyrinogen decarboxylase family protein [Candidatus Sumerlaeota bacterium]
MRPEQWRRFKSAAKRQTVDQTPLALIVDSPWIPGFLGISHWDYYFDSEAWFQANLRIMKEFPEVIFFPSWWAECGMAAEPSTLGVRVRFWRDRTPDSERMPFRLEDVDKIKPVEPRSDGFMPLTLHRYATMKQRIFDAGYTIPVVAARGPLCTAGFMRGITELMMDVFQDPDGVKRLLDLTTRVTIDWLKAQAEAIGPSVEGILVLDDIVGFLGLEHYEEFAHPYLKRICDAFPKEWVKVYHNDANVAPFLEKLPDTGFDALNWGKNLDVAEAAERLQGRMTLMGNVNPLEIGVRGAAEEVYQAALDVLKKTGGRNHILSMGGGVSPGMPAENIRAMVRAMHDFNGKKAGA